MILFKRNTVAEKSVWHKWFAWHPVKIGETPDGDAKYVWREYIMRCGTLKYGGYGESYWDWKYKRIKNKKEISK